MAFKRISFLKRKIPLTEERMWSLLMVKPSSPLRIVSFIQTICLGTSLFGLSITSSLMSLCFSHVSETMKLPQLINHDTFK